MADDLQQLINDQIDGRRIGGGVSLPKGEFVVEKKLEIVRVRGFKFGGQAPLARQLRWTGPDDQPMFLLDRCKYTLFEDFSIIVADGKNLLAAAQIQNVPPDETDLNTPPPDENDSEAASGPDTSHVWWRNVRVFGNGRLASDVLPDDVGVEALSDRVDVATAQRIDPVEHELHPRQRSSVTAHGRSRSTHRLAKQRSGYHWRF